MMMIKKTNTGRTFLWKCINLYVVPFYHNVCEILYIFLIFNTETLLSTDLQTHLLHKNYQGESNISAFVICYATNYW